jgi:hypothetical protein
VGSTARRNGVPVGPDYRMLSSGRFDGNDSATQQILARPEGTAS